MWPHSDGGWGRLDFTDDAVLRHPRGWACHTSRAAVFWTDETERIYERDYGVAILRAKALAVPGKRIL